MFFVAFQSEANENNPHDYFIKHVKETIVMKILKQVRTNVNYIAHMSDCMIEICNTHTIILVIKDIFSHNLTSIYTEHEMDLIVYFESQEKNDDGKHRNRSCAGEQCFS